MNPNQNTARGNNEELALSETELYLLLYHSALLGVLCYVNTFLKTVHIRVLNKSLYSVVFLLIELIV